MTKSAGLVLSAVQQGVSDERAIAIWTACTPAEVKTHLGYLEAQQLVRKEGRRGWLPVIRQAARA